MFKAVFVLWLLVIVVGLVLSTRGARQGNARKQAAGRRLLLSAGLVVLAVIAVLTYTTLVSNRG